VIAPMLVLGLAFQLGPAVKTAYSAWSDPATSASFWRPVVRFLKANPDVQFRTEVVATQGHWEAFYLAKRGIALARGWFRQDDFPQNRVLYQPTLSADQYQSWLRSVGVRYVLLPKAPLDYSAVTEAHLLRSGRSGLRRVAQLPHWTVYALPRPTPILTPDEPAPGTSVISMTDSRISLWLPTAGAYDLRVRYSPYWSTDVHGACLSATASGMTHVVAPQAGALTLEFEPTFDAVAAAAASASESCT
jgi:hypothetical protein